MLDKLRLFKDDDLLAKFIKLWDNFKAFAISFKKLFKDLDRHYLNRVEGQKGKKPVADTCMQIFK